MSSPRFSLTRLLRRRRSAVPNSAPAKLRPIPVTEWGCLCSRLWSDEDITAVCGMCEGGFQKSVVKTAT